MSQIRFGAFSYYYASGSISEMAAGIRRNDFDCVQLSDFPVPITELNEHICQDIKQTFDHEGIAITSCFVQGNLSHPDANIRNDMIEKIRAMVHQVKHLGTDIVSFMPGSRNPSNEWMYHPDNETKEAFEDVVSVISDLAAYARTYGVRLCIEPFFFSIVHSTEKMKQLVERCGTNVGVMYDPAATIGPDRIHDTTAALNDDFGQLFDRFFVVHVEDVRFENGQPVYVLPGEGGVNWSVFYDLLKKYGWNSPIHLEINAEYEKQREEVRSALAEV